jgi:hypothetical protein
MSATSIEIDAGSSHSTDLDLSAEYRIDGWTYEEQVDWINNPVGPAEFSDCIGIVDGVYARVERPKDSKLERRLYSTYKKYHSVFFLVIVDRKGTLDSKRLMISVKHSLTCSPF